MKKRLFLVGLGVILVSILVWVAQVWAQGKKGGKPRAAAVVVAPVVSREVTAERSFVGTVAPLRISTVGSAVDGRVETLLFDEGQRVSKGKPIAQLRTQIIKAELENAKATLLLRQAELEELINGSRPEELELARAQVANADAMRRLRNNNRDRARSSGGAISRQERDEASALANVAGASFLEAKARLKLIEKGPRWEKIAQAQANVEAEQAAVERIAEQVKRHQVMAPFDGYVVAKRAEVGQWAKRGDPVAVIAELDQVYVETPVLEDYVGGLREGTPAKVQVSALPGDTFKGKVDLIIPQADLRTRTFPVKVIVENQVSGNEVLLKAGMFARVTLPVKQTEALLVPKDALVLVGESRKVFVVDPNPNNNKQGKVRAVPVTLGVSQKGWIQVVGELQPGQQVVTQGNERLRPGQPVEIVREETP